MRIIRLRTEVTRERQDEIELEIPVGFVPFAVYGPEPTGNQVRDTVGPFPMSVWCHDLPSDPTW